MHHICHRFAFAAFLAANVSACTTDPVPPTLTAKQYCEELARIDCHKYFDCYTDAKRASIGRTQAIGSTKQECETDRRAACAVKPYVCPAEGIFQFQNAGACVRALDVVSCDDWNIDNLPDPAACNNVCMKNPF